MTPLQNASGMINSNDRESQEKRSSTLPQNQEYEIVAIDALNTLLNQQKVLKEAKSLIVRLINDYVNHLVYADYLKGLWASEYREIIEKYRLKRVSYLGVLQKLGIAGENIPMEDFRRAITAINSLLESVALSKTEEAAIQALITNYENLVHWKCFNSSIYVTNSNISLFEDNQLIWEVEYWGNTGLNYATRLH